MKKLLLSLAISVCFIFSLQAQTITISDEFQDFLTDNGIDLNDFTMAMLTVINDQSALDASIFDDIGDITGTNLAAILSGLSTEEFNSFVNALITELNTYSTDEVEFEGEVFLASLMEGGVYITFNGDGAEAVPIDGGLVYLLAAGIGFAAMRIRRNKK